jgi:hypothetical protein
MAVSKAKGPALARVATRRARTGQPRAIPASTGRDAVEEKILTALQTARSPLSAADLHERLGADPSSEAEKQLFAHVIRRLIGRQAVVITPDWKLRARA